MGIYVEAIILYVILFLSGVAGNPAANTGAEGFSAAAELTVMFTHTIPSLALIWYLMLRVRRLKDWGIVPGRKDLLSLLITLPCLLIAGFVIAYISSYIGGTSAQVLIHSPSTFTGWFVLCISCVSAAYLEESFFRFYLLSRRDELKLSAASALVFSVALFSICHIYEGPWGFLNAVISGMLLAFIFLRYKSLHGIAIAHSLYNISVYAANSLMFSN